MILHPCRQPVRSACSACRPLPQQQQRSACTGQQRLLFWVEHVSVHWLLLHSCAGLPSCQRINARVPPCLATPSSWHPLQASFSEATLLDIRSPWQLNSWFCMTCT
jgi:hypothetical protein